MFRTRSGDYRVSQNELESKSDNLLHRNVASIKASVLEGADIKSSSFFGSRKSLNRHGQHPRGAYGFGYADKLFLDDEEVQKDQKSPTTSASME